MERLLKSTKGIVISKFTYGIRCTSSYAVMSFGDGSHGALGLPTSLTGIGGDAYEPTKVLGLPSDIVNISAGHYHSLAVDSQGSLWTWGRDQEGQLGRGIPYSRAVGNEPKRVLGLERVNVRGAFASGTVTAAIGDDGSLWVWGKSKRGQLGLGKGITEALLPSRVEALAGEKMVKVSLGWGHALGLSEDGKLFGWGYCAEGRLGSIGKDVEASLPCASSDTSKSESQLSSSVSEIAEKLVLETLEKEKNMPILWEPRLVKEFDGIEVVDIACGLDHSLILSRNGILQSCGNNIYGQLGRIKKDDRMLPVDIICAPSSVAAGLGHSLALCRPMDGKEASTNIASWGWNQTSQLGREGPDNLPLLVQVLVGEVPVSVSGGRAHSIALMENGEVWVWGCGKNGRLGTGSSVDEVEPIMLYSLEGFKVIQAVSGFDHNLVLVAE